MNAAVRTRVLTGITTTGTPHLGNYVGAIRPAVQASRDPGTDAFFFLADYHALIKCDDPHRIERSTLEIAASWLAAGLDPQTVTFYRQSDIPEIPELCWLLTCVTGKGMLNRAHAYKAAVDKNVAQAKDHDTDVTAGLFMYPVLMGADILMFKAHQVPVGRDQIQHIEMARDMAASFNHLYGEHFVLPQASIDDHVALLPGLDGRKMSKSYDNTIALFAPPAQLRKQIMGIVTDSKLPGEPKSTQGSALFEIYQAFASADETATMARDFAQGIAWSEAKERLVARIEQEVAPMRSRYQDLIENPSEVERCLTLGAEKARHLARPFMQELRHAVGLRGLSRTASPTPHTAATAGKAAVPTFKQYRESDGLFYFKLVSPQGHVLLQSTGFAAPREAGQCIRLLQQKGPVALESLRPQLVPLSPQDWASAELALQTLVFSLGQDGLI